jgi:hypothetical protein
MRNFKPVLITLEPKQIAWLKKLSKKTKTPYTKIIRDLIDYKMKNEKIIRDLITGQMK